MWTNIESFRPFVESLQFAFTQPSFTTHGTLLLAWIMCLGRHRLIKVFQNSAPQFPVDNSQRHGFDTFYNFFERSAWTPRGLAYHLGVLIFTRLPVGGVVTLLVDDTLAHKRGKYVWGIRWVCVCFVFFVNYTATPEIYPLSLHVSFPVGTPRGLAYPLALLIFATFVSQGVV